jgi:hypothetical protein
MKKSVKLACHKVNSNVAIGSLPTLQILLGIVALFEKIYYAVVGAPPKESVGAPDQMTSANTASQRGGTPLLSPLPPSSLYCNLYINAVP